MKHVAIFMFPGYGHVNPTLELSRCLVGLGHRVTHVVDQRHAADVVAADAEAVVYASGRARLGNGAVTGEDIGALGLNFLRESMEAILPRTLEAFRDDVPDLVLYDLESFFTARTAARVWGRPTAQLFPYVASNEHFSLAQQVFDGATENVQRCIDLLTEHLTAQGEEPDAVWSFMVNFDERNLVLLPREFQPRGETFDERYTFVGHSLPTGQSDTGSWVPPADGRPVVLITLGTEVNDHPDFFRLCGTAFADAGWHVVMTVGPGNLPAGPAQLDHVEIHEWLAFRTVLPHVSAVVCHAGMSTMLEALYFGKPLVVVTWTPEDRVNGARTEALGLGRTLPGEGLVPARLRTLVEEITADPEVRRRVARMRTAMLAAGGPARAALVVEGWLEQGRSPADLLPAGGIEGDRR